MSKLRAKYSMTGLRLTTAASQIDGVLLLRVGVRIAVVTADRLQQLP
jgi:hypothetical protein